MEVEKKSIHIVMIGDSFGVPNYYGPPGIPPEFHVEFLLRERKYNVINLSKNGSKNITHYSELNEFVEKNPTVKIDFVVWFHNNNNHVIFPEFIKNEVPASLSIESQKENIKVYQLMKELRNQLTAKWFVIGGSAPIPSYFYKYQLHDNIINDWRELILKENLPWTNFFTYTKDSPYVNSELNLDSDELKKYLTSNGLIIDKKVKQARNLFPDGVHPGIAPHQQLADMLEIFFKSQIA